MSWKPYIKPAARCGTEAGYARHRDRGEPTCTDCKAAHARGERRRRARKAKHRYLDWAA